MGRFLQLQLPFLGIFSGMGALTGPQLTVPAAGNCNRGYLSWEPSQLRGSSLDSSSLSQQLATASKVQAESGCFMCRPEESAPRRLPCNWSHLPGMFPHLHAPGLDCSPAQFSDALLVL